MAKTMEIDLTNKFMFHPALKLAIEEAKLSTYQHKIGCVIFKGKRIVSSAHNAIRTSKVPNKFKHYIESLHAEAHCIIKARKNLKGYSILVIRLNNRGNLVLAKPCEFCSEFIEYVGIKNVYYSNKGKIVMEDNQNV